MLIINISMSTLTDSATWYEILDGSERQSQCTISFYQKASYLNCTSGINKDGLTVECLSSKMYPKGLCVFDTNLETGTGKTVMMDNPKQRDAANITNKCTHSVPVAKLINGTIKVTTTVYPNVTGLTSDKEKYGKNSTIIVTIEKPVVRLDNCPSTVKEGDNVTCHCQRDDSSNVDTVILWYDTTSVNVNNGSLSTVNGSLSFTVDRDKQAKYYCQSENIFEWKSEIVIYQPKISMPQIIKQFSINNEVNKSISINLLANMSLLCKVEEADNQLVELSKDGNILDSTRNSTITWTKNSTSCDDAGVYQCNVSRYHEWTHDNLTVTVCEMPSPVDGSTDSTLSLVILISIGAGGIVGILIIFAVLFKVVTELTIYSKQKCSKKTTEMENDDIYDINFPLEKESEPMAGELKRTHSSVATPKIEKNYNNINSELKLRL